jgi:phosphatidylserine/phosphatidylglycerophosphate/cardiolipin synthase-like enzyme
MAFVGSQNLTPGGLAWNREVGILVSDTTALGQLKQAFESDWDESTDVSALN